MGTIVSTQSEIAFLSFFFKDVLSHYGRSDSDKEELKKIMEALTHMFAVQKNGEKRQDMLYLDWCEYFYDYYTVYHPT